MAARRTIDTHAHFFPERFLELVARHGGRYLVRGGAMQPVEGALGLKRLVILEFPSMEALRGFYDSAEYAPLLQLRLDSTQSDVVFVEGYAPPA